MLRKRDGDAASEVSPLRRLQTLGDVVFAVALISLGLVFPWQEPRMDVPNPAWELVERTYTDFIAIAITYVVVGLYWYSHVNAFGMLRRLSAAQISLQLGYLFGVMVLPFTVWMTVELGEYTTSLVLHSANLLWIGLFGVAAWLEASRGNKLVDEDLDRQSKREILRSQLLEPAVLVLSIIVAPLGMVWWSASFLLLFVVPLLQALIGRASSSAA